MRKFDVITIGQGRNMMKIEVPADIQAKLTAWAHEKTSYWYGPGANWLPVMFKMGIPINRVIPDEQSLLTTLGLKPTAENRERENLERLVAVARQMGFHLVGWDAEAEVLEINFFRDVLLPWLDAKASWHKVFQGALAGWQAKIGQMASVSEIIETVLTEGVVNHTYLNGEQMKKLFAVSFAASGAEAQFSAIQSWSRSERIVSEDGEVSENDTSTFAWMLASRNQYSRISKLTTLVQKKVVAAGTFYLSGHQSINIVSALASDSGEIHRIIARDSGKTPSIHQKGVRVWFNMGIYRVANGVRDFMGDLRKPSKSAARRQLPLGVLAIEDGLVDSSLAIEIDGEAVPMTTGVNRRVAITNLVGLVGSGVCLLREAIDVRDPRSLRLSMSKEDFLKADLSSKIGKTFKHGEEIAHGEYNTHGYPIVVRKVSHQFNRSRTFYKVRVDYEILVRSQAPKFRSPGIKASGMVWLDRSIFSKFSNAQIVFTQETVKQPHIALMMMWAQTTGTLATLGEHGLAPEHEAAFLKWYAQNKKVVNVQFRVSPESAPYYKAAEEAGSALKLFERGRNLWCSQQVEYVTGNMPVSVEATVTELRMTRTSVTPHMSLRRAAQMHDIQKVPGIKLNTLNEARSLTIREARQLMELPWKRLVKKGMSLFPKGMRFDFYEAGGELNSVIVDWTAIEWLSTGDIVPDDRLSAHLHLALSCKSLLIPSSEFPPEPEENKDEWESKMAEIVKSNDELIEVMSTEMRLFVYELHFVAISPSILKRVLRPTEDFTTQLVVRTVDTFGPDLPSGNEVLVSPATLAFMQKHGMKYGVGDAFVSNRYPTPFDTTLKLAVSEHVPNGVMLVQNFYQQVPNFGDADGDTDVLTPEAEYPSVLRLNRRERNRVSALVTMLIANTTEYALPDMNRSSLPDNVYNWDEGEIDNRNEQEKASSRYHLFTDISECEMTKWLIQKPLWNILEGVPFVDQISLTVSIEQFQLTAEQIAEFTTFGIGGIYGMADALSVLAAFWRGVNTARYQTLHSSSTVAWWIYENVFLSGTPNEITWRLWEVMKQPRKENFDEWMALLAKIGVPAEMALPTGQTLGEVLWLSRMQCLAYNNMLRGVAPRSEWLGALGWMAEYNQLELNAFARLAFSGSFGLRRSSEPMLKPEMVAKALEFVSPQSQFGIMYADLIRTVAPHVLAVSARASAVAQARDEY